MGIGGIFFRARDPKALAEGYRDHPGIEPVPENYEPSGGQQQPYPHGRFARTHDPEGHPSELWQPVGRA